MLALFSPDRLTRSAVRHPWLVVGTWVVLLVGALASASTLGGVLTTEAETYRESDSSRGEAILEERFFGREPLTETVVIRSDSLTVDDPAFAAKVNGVVGQLRALGGLEVVSFFETNAQTLVSESGRTLLVPVMILQGSADDRAEDVLHVLEGVNGREGFTAVTGGEGSIAVAFNETSESDLQTAEIIGLPIALIILVGVFGALVAAGVPLLLGVLSIIVAVGLTAIIGRTFELSIFVINIITTMGLAVGIDYSLVVIQRVREERANGLSRDAAIEKAGATASWAVLFSGLTVVVALSGLILVPQSIFRSMGAGAIVVVLAAVAAALTLLPAVLRLLGDRIDSVRIGIPGRRRAGGGRSFWDRSTGLVMRHPVISVVASAGLLLAAALPYATVELGWAGVSTLPADSSAREAFAILDEDFSAGIIGPARVVIESDELAAAPVQGGSIHSWRPSPATRTLARLR